MTYYFEDPEKQAQLKIILDSWLGTPFRHHCGVKTTNGKDGGADCIHFVAKVFSELGVFVWKKGLIPDYNSDWHLHNTRELLKERLDSPPEGVKLEKVDITGPYMNGDVILAHYGKAASHSMIYYDDYVYQALTDVGVVKISFKNSVFKKAIKFVYRMVN